MEWVTLLLALVGGLVIMLVLTAIQVLGARGVPDPGVDPRSNDDVVAAWLAAAGDDGHDAALTWYFASDAVDRSPGASESQDDRREGLSG